MIVFQWNNWLIRQQKEVTAVCTDTRPRGLHQEMPVRIIICSLQWNLVLMLLPLKLRKGMHVPDVLLKCAQRLHTFYIIIDLNYFLYAIKRKGRWQERSHLSFFHVTARFSLPCPVKKNVNMSFTPHISKMEWLNTCHEEPQYIIFTTRHISCQQRACTFTPYARFKVDRLTITPNQQKQSCISTHARCFLLPIQHFQSDVGYNVLCLPLLSAECFLP